MKKLLLVLLFCFICIPKSGFAATVTLAWDASTTTSVTGYKIYVSTTTMVYGNGIDVGKVLTYTVPNLLEGTKYYFVATAYNPGAESDYSNEVNTITPWSKPLPPNLKSIQASSAALDSAKENIVKYLERNRLNKSSLQYRLLNNAISNINNAKNNVSRFLNLVVVSLLQNSEGQQQNLRIIASN